MQVPNTKLNNDDTQFEAVVKDRDPKNTFHFGQAGASDMTQRGNENRKQIQFQAQKERGLEHIRIRHSRVLLKAVALEQI